MRKLDEIFWSQPRSKPEFYTLERICELVEPRDKDELIVTLGRLVHSGKIKSIVRVVDPATQGGIGDFESINDVPRVIDDWRSGQPMEVKPEDLRFIYVLPAAK